VSVQVINEVCVNLLRRAAFAESAIPSLIESFFATCEVVHPSQGTLVTASTLRQRYSLSFWDSLIITAAIEAGASILHTEDMQHGLLVDGKLTIVNPFA
jgi:predicted nucleic acid-binding protein